jgi:hypothetical protein
MVFDSATSRANIPFGSFVLRVLARFPVQEVARLTKQRFVFAKVVLHSGQEDIVAVTFGDHGSWTEDKHAGDPRQR